MKRSICYTGPYDHHEVSEKVTIVERNDAPGSIPLMNVWAVTKKSPNDLVELAMEIESADNYIKSTACSKLQVIAEQMQFLHKQAHQVLSAAKEDNRLHHAACNFVKIPGHIYHLYRKSSGQEYFSMISPKEWSDHPDNFLASYRLEYNKSWTHVNDLQERDEDMNTIEAALGLGVQGQLSWK